MSLLIINEDDLIKQGLPEQIVKRYAVHLKLGLNRFQNNIIFLTEGSKPKEKTMDSKSQEKVANSGLFILRPDYNELTIKYKSAKNATSWKDYENGFKDKKALDKKLKSVLSEHKNFIQD